jgi:hypothetical protein
VHGFCYIVKLINLSTIFIYSGLYYLFIMLKKIKRGKLAELSINMIIVAIIAIVVLVVVLFIFRGQTKDVAQGYKDITGKALGDNCEGFLGPGGTCRTSCVAGEEVSIDGSGKETKSSITWKDCDEKGVGEWKCCKEKVKEAPAEP